jgi:hypothetical protein
MLGTVCTAYMHAHLRQKQDSITSSKSGLHCWQSEVLASKLAPYLIAVLPALGLVGELYVGFVKKSPVPVWCWPYMSGTRHNSMNNAHHMTIYLCFSLFGIYEVYRRRVAASVRHDDATGTALSRMGLAFGLYVLSFLFTNHAKMGLMKTAHGHLASIVNTAAVLVLIELLLCLAVTKSTAKVTSAARMLLAYGRCWAFLASGLYFIVLAYVFFVWELPSTDGSDGTVALLYVWCLLLSFLVVALVSVLMAKLTCFQSVAAALAYNGAAEALAQGSVRDNQYQQVDFQDDIELSDQHSSLDHSDNEADLDLAF